MAPRKSVDFSRTKKHSECDSRRGLNSITLFPLVPCVARVTGMIFAPRILVLRKTIMKCFSKSRLHLWRTTTKLIPEAKQRHLRVMLLF
ncbi:hypothetical protein K474DRAFT_654882 [Panus rudis PR-1116 ss-1]|nr:hypothetical protein K474DRAFT_654882 [Panus rudis PR-1116 ss-1]